MISKLTDQEKSVMLAKARGWVQQVGMVWYWKDDHADYVIGSPKDLGTQIPNLYEAENMALAWRVHQWKLRCESEEGDQRFAHSQPMPYSDWCARHFPWYKEHNDAQRLWLDRILELVIEAEREDEKKDTEMTDQEKSLLLAKAMGWQLNDLTEPFDWRDENNEALPMTFLITDVRPNLYDPANMSLAWRVHLWALAQTDIGSTYHEWWFKEWPWYEQNQRLWLDKILELAIEAGIVEVDDEMEMGQVEANAFAYSRGIVIK